MATVAELCAGYGGLAMALLLLDPSARLAWVAETDPDASTVLAHNHPDALNHGDITHPLGLPFGQPRRHLAAPRRSRRDARCAARRIGAWRSMAEPVDVLTAGFPCQPFSLSGCRAGSKDKRHLWPTGVLPAIQALQPAVVLLENVEGLRTVQRGAVFRQILADLMMLGYTVRWATLGACKLGLCQHRHRMFILATRAVGELPPELGMPLVAWSSWPRDGVASAGDVWEHASDPCGTTGLTLPTPTARDAERGGGWGDRPGRPLSEVIAMLPTPTASDGTGGPGHTADGGENLRTAVTLLPTPTTVDGTAGIGAGRRRDGRDGVPNLRTAMGLLPTPKATDATKGGPNQRGSSGALALPAAVQPERWGRYAAAVASHEQVIGRPAPEPTIIGKRGGRRLNPQLTEWMQGLPEGWITGPLANNPNAANRAAGNGVIPLVAAAAVRLMSERAGWANLYDQLS